MTLWSGSLTIVIPAFARPIEKPPLKTFEINVYDAYSEIFPLILATIMCRLQYWRRLRKNVLLPRPEN